MIVVVSAMAEELAPLAKRLGSPRRVAGSRQVEGRLGGETLRLVATGAGRQRAVDGIRALAEAAERGEISWDWMLLVGVAGGLDPDLRLGDVVRVGRVVRIAGPSTTEPEEVSGHRLPARDPGVAVTVDRIVAEASDKEALWLRLGRPETAVVDMESFHWLSALSGAACVARQTLLRAVSDSAETSLPSFLAGCVGPNGEISRARVAAASLRRPRSVTELLRLRRDVRVASTRLADAIEDLACGGSVP